MIPGWEFKCLQWVMHLRYPFLFILFFLSTLTSLSAYTPHPQLQTAYDDLFDLRLQSARQITQHSFTTVNDQAFALYIRSLSHFMELVLVKDQEKYKAYQDLRADIQQEIRDLEDQNTWTAFISAEIRLHEGLVHIFYGDDLRGGIRLIQSYHAVPQDLTSNEYDHYFNKTSGVLHIMLSLVPENYAWILKFFRIHPDIRLGRKQLGRIASDPENIFHREGLVLLSLLDAFYGDIKQAASIVEQTEIYDHNSLIINYLNGIISTKCYDNEHALKCFRSSQATEDDQMPLHQAGYRLADVYLKKLELDSAHQYYQVFLDKVPAGPNRVDGYYKLALIYYLKKQNEEAADFMEKALEAEPVNEADRYARYMAGQAGFPHPGLVKARLLFDGGYFIKALDQLTSLTPRDLSKYEYFEYHYRLGRIYQLTDEYEKAMDQFELVISMESFRDHYLTANAHLQMGHILLDREMKEEAMVHYKMASGYGDGPYAESIRNEARAGIKRAGSND